MGSKQNGPSGRPVPLVAYHPTGDLSQGFTTPVIPAPPRAPYYETTFQSVRRKNVSFNPESHSDLMMNPYDVVIKTTPNVAKSHGHIHKPIPETKDMLAQPWPAALDSDAPACIPTSCILNDLDEDAYYGTLSTLEEMPDIPCRPAQSIVQDSTHLSPGAQSPPVASYSQVKLDTGQGVAHEASCDCCEKVGRIIYQVVSAMLMCPLDDYWSPPQVLGLRRLGLLLYLLPHCCKNPSGPPLRLFS
jgi:hypothetical protein